jgi:hypothetical protein
MDPVPDPIASAVYGLGKLVADGVSRFLERVGSHELSGSQDPEVIDLVKAERKVPEFVLLKKYIPDRNLRVQVQLGLALRKIQSRPNHASALSGLRNHLQRAFGLAGLHVAELAEVGIVTAYVQLLTTEEETDADVINRLETFLRRVDTYVLFVVGSTPVDRVIERVRLRLAAGGPGTVAIFAKGAACEKLHRIVKELRKDREDYIIRTSSSGDQEIVFVTSISVWLRTEEAEPPKRLAKAAAKTSRPGPAARRRRRRTAV